MCQQQPEESVPARSTGSHGGFRQRNSMCKGPTKNGINPDAYTDLGVVRNGCSMDFQGVRKGQSRLKKVSKCMNI